MAVDTTPAHPAVMADQISAGETVSDDSPLPEPVVQTSRLIIRNMHPQDAPVMQEICAPFEITKYMTLAFAHPYTMEHAKTWIAINVEDPDKNYVMCLKESPECVIGGIGIKPGSDVQSHVAEVGYWLGMPYWGKGLTTEALRAFTSYIFTERHETYSRLWASVCGGNVASTKILERCGYLNEGNFRGHVRKHGETRDLHLYGLTREDWELLWRGKEVRKRDEEGKVWIWT